MRTARSVIGIALGLAIGVGDPALGEDLFFVGARIDGLDGVDGLARCTDVVASADGRHVYATGYTDEAVAAFAIDGLGRLAFLEVERDGEGGVTGLRAPSGLAASPGGEHLYVTGGDAAVVVFARDATTGELDFVEFHQEGSGGVTGLIGARAVVVSPDSAHLYVASLWGAADGNGGVAAFARDEVTGGLTFVDAWLDGEIAAGGPIDGLGGAGEVVVSPDGLHVYVLGHVDEAVALFSRDVTTGELTYLGATFGFQVADAAISPDGAHLYVASSNRVLVFARDATTGALTFTGGPTDGVDGVVGLSATSAVAVSPTGTYVAATGRINDSLVLFRRNPATGALTYLDTAFNGYDGVNGLDFPTSATFADGDRFAYTSSWRSHAVGAFALALFSDGFESGDTSAWSVP